jgi:glutamate dehydrogenase/leucine dehydrogenase
VPDILANAGGVTVSYFEWLRDSTAYTSRRVNFMREHLNRRVCIERALEAYKKVL